MTDEQITAAAKKIRTRTYEVVRFALRWWVKAHDNYPGLVVSEVCAGPFNSRKKAEEWRAVLIGETADQGDPAI